MEWVIPNRFSALLKILARKEESGYPGTEPERTIQWANNINIRLRGMDPTKNYYSHIKWGILKC